jgi:hypothetical protein
MEISNHDVTWTFTTHISPYLVSGIDVAEVIAAQISNPNSNRSFVLFLVNLWSTKGVTWLSTLFALLVDKLTDFTGLTHEIVRRKVLLEIIEKKQLAEARRSRRDINEYVFRLYNKIPKMLDPFTFVYAPAFVIENNLHSPKFSIESPIHASHLILEPDRIVWLEYGIMDDLLFALWRDCYGEFQETAMIPVTDPESAISELLRESKRWAGDRGFTWRLGVRNVLGWNPKGVERWMKAISMMFGAGKANEFDMEPSTNTPIHMESLLEQKTPANSPKDPTTPASSYNTPQPAMTKKPKKKEVKLNISSITLLEIQDGFLQCEAKSNAFASSNKAESFFTPESTFLVPMSGKIILGDSEMTPLAAIWIFSDHFNSARLPQDMLRGDIFTHHIPEQTSNDAPLGSKQLLLYYHWQTEHQQTSRFQWDKADTIAKDFARNVTNLQLLSKVGHNLLDKVLLYQKIKERTGITD